MYSGTIRDSLVRMNVPPPGGPSTRCSFVMPQPGDLVAAKYRVVRILGECGMGVVQEAPNQRLRQLGDLAVAPPRSGAAGRERQDGAAPPKAVAARPAPIPKPSAGSKSTASTPDKPLFR